MASLPSCHHRFAVQGHAVEVLCEAAILNLPIQGWLGEFAVDEFPEGFVPTSGRMRLYDQQTISRHLSPQATPITRPGAIRDIYQDGSQFWIVDDRWGLTEINLLRNQWQSWILPELTEDPISVVQDAVIWPMAQLLRRRGLHLLPAVSLVRDGWGMLMISPVGMEPELSALIHAGFRIIGQQWTALREEDDRVAMLHVPGMVQRQPAARIGAEGAMRADYEWIDVTAGRDGSSQNHAFCDAVLLIEPGRRAMSSVRSINRSGALPLLRQSWPIFELHPERLASSLIGRLASTARLYSVSLSRKAESFLQQLDLLRYGRAFKGGAKVEVQVYSPDRRQIPA